MDAPKRIWAWPHFDGWITGDWSANTYYDDRTVEYILASEHGRIVAEKDKVLIQCAASLAAAISLLERGGKKAAPSDKMFDQMLLDYKASLDLARAALKGDDNG